MFKKYDNREKRAFDTKNRCLIISIYKNTLIITFVVISLEIVVIIIIVFIITVIMKQGYRVTRNN